MPDAWLGDADAFLGTPEEELPRELTRFARETGAPLQKSAGDADGTRSRSRWPTMSLPHLLTWMLSHRVGAERHPPAQS